MAADSLPCIPLAELGPGQPAEFLAILQTKQKRLTRLGKAFFHCRFRDRHVSIASVIWEQSPLWNACGDWQEGTIVRVRGAIVVDDRFGHQLEILDLRSHLPEDEKSGLRATDLVTHSRHNPEAMFAELRELAMAQLASRPIRELVGSLLDRNREGWLRFPATLNKFYPFAGGLLEHTLSVARKCVWLVDQYRSDYPHMQAHLNRDVVIAAAILHDIGRIREYDGALLDPGYTVEGRLKGHMFLAVEMIQETARDIDGLPAEAMLLLEHVVISHLNLPEWGSPRLPLVPESLILHHADDLDAKVEMYLRSIANDPASGPFTERHGVLDRHLFKGRRE